MGSRHFPLFLDLSKCPIILFGGGKVAFRRAQVLCSFGAQIQVISPDCLPELESLGIPILYREYRPGDCTGAQIVLAATNNRQVNHAIFQEAKSKGILVNACDAPEECDFYFPAVVEWGPLVLGLTSGGENHHLVRQAAQELREHLGDWMVDGAGNSCGKSRERAGGDPKPAGYGVDSRAVSPAEIGTSDHENHR